MENKNEQIPLTEGAKIILNTIKDEFFPIQKELMLLLKEVQELRIKNLVYSREIHDLNKKYEELSPNFFDIAIKLKTPDILFKSLERNNSMQNMASYFQFKNAIEDSINEGFKYIEIIDRTLDRKNEKIQNSRTLILALLALIISMISIF